jgi:hypothetical protein
MLTTQSENTLGHFLVSSVGASLKNSREVTELGLGGRNLISDKSIKMCFVAFGITLGHKNFFYTNGI